MVERTLSVLRKVKLKDRVIFFSFFPFQYYFIFFIDLNANQRKRWSYFWLGLWCSTLHSTIVQLYRGGKFYWWRKPKDPKKTTDLPRVTDKLHHTMLYRGHLIISRIRTHNFSYLISNDQYRSLTLNNIENKSASQNLLCMLL